MVTTVSSIPNCMTTPHRLNPSPNIGSMEVEGAPKIAPPPHPEVVRVGGGITHVVNLSGLHLSLICILPGLITVLLATLTLLVL